MSSTTPVGSSPIVPNGSSAVTNQTSQSSQTSQTAPGISSTLTSAAPSQATGGYSQQISDFVSWVVDKIRGLLAYIPFIGSYFEKTPVSQTSTTPGQSSTGTTPVFTDAEIVAMIVGQFPGQPPAPQPNTTAPDARTTDYLLGVFDTIRDDASKIEALKVVQTATNSTDAFVQQFYGRLSDNLKNTIKGAIYAANNNSAVSADGIDRGMGYGDHMINTAPRGPIVRQALDAVLAHLRPAQGSSTSGSSSSSGSVTP